MSKISVGLSSIVKRAGQLLVVHMLLLAISNNSFAQCVSEFTIAGGGTYCPGESTYSWCILLRGTRSDTQYKLYRNGVYTGILQYGNDSWSSDLCFDDLQMPGTFNIHVVKTGCTEIVSNDVVYSQVDGSLNINPSSNFTFCSGSGLISAFAPSATSFQWLERIDNIDRIITGATSSTFAPDHTGYYSVRVTSQCGTMTSATIQATLNTPTLPTVQQPYIIAYNSTAILQASGAASGESYQWYSASTGGVPLTSTTINNVTQTTTYYVSKVSAYSCESSPRVPFDVTVNRLPVANAGPDQIITLPLSQVTLSGSGSDPDGTVSSYQWIQISGNAVLQGSLAGSEITIDNLTAGVYVFRLTVTDNYDFQTYDDVTVSVVYPPNNYNWITETTVLVPGKTTKDAVEALQIESGERSVSWNYFDGLGRPMQTIITQGSPSGQDIVRPIAYDLYGRESRKYLSYASEAQGDGSFKTNALNSTGIFAFYHPATGYSSEGVAKTTAPFAETVFENSALNRVLKQGAPGETWQPNGDPGDWSDPSSMADKSVKIKYETNISDDVLLFHYDPATEVIGVSGIPAERFYHANQLFVLKTFDEHNNEVIEYKDKEGRTICKKVQYKEEAGAKYYAITYYIYDDYGNLVVVLPPEGVNRVLSILED